MCPPLPAARSALGAGLQARGRLGQGPGFPPRSGAGGRAGGWAGGRAGRRWAGELCAAWELLLQGSWGETGPRVGTAPVGGKSLPRLLQLSKCTGASPAWRACSECLRQAATTALQHLQPPPGTACRTSPSLPGCSLPLSSGSAWAPSPRAAAAPLTTQGPRRLVAALLQPAAGRPPPRLATTCCSTPSPSWPAPPVRSRPGGCRPLRSRKSSPPRSLPSPAGRPARRAQPRPGPSWGLGCPG